MARYKRLIRLGELSYSKNEKSFDLKCENLKLNSWLLMTRREESVCLRDYSGETVTEFREFTNTNINDLLTNPKNFREENTAYFDKAVEEIDFWKEEIEEKNQLFDNSQDDTPQEPRLLDEFKKQFEDCEDKSLNDLFNGWKEKLCCIKDKSQFNHWDNDCFHTHIVDKHGEEQVLERGDGWQAMLLKHCRSGPEMKFLTTDKDLKFCFIASELHLGISSQNNSFGREGRDFLKLDGLGVRPCGGFTVFEVKGPQDDRNLLAPMLQAVCYALAIVAKQDMIRQIAENPVVDAKRMKIQTDSPLKDRSVGVHVLTANWRTNNGQLAPFEERWNREENAILPEAKRIFGAFKELKYIAFSCLGKNNLENLGVVPVQRLISSDVYTS